MKRIMPERGPRGAAGTTILFSKQSLVQKKVILARVSNTRACYVSGAVIEVFLKFLCSSSPSSLGSLLQRWQTSTKQHDCVRPTGRSGACWHGWRRNANIIKRHPVVTQHRVTAGTLTPTNIKAQTRKQTSIHREVWRGRSLWSRLMSRRRKSRRKVRR